MRATARGPAPSTSGSTALATWCGWPCPAVVLTAPRPRPRRGWSLGYRRLEDLQLALPDPIEVTWARSTRLAAAFKECRLPP